MQQRSASAGRGAGGPRGVRLSRELFSYLGRGIALNCLVAFLVLEAVQAIIFTVRATEDLGMEILIIFPVLLRAFLQATSYSLPIALLFGTSLFLGRLSADREVFAFRSFGVSPTQIILPVAAIGGVLTAAALVLNLEWAPRMRYANRQVDELLIEQLGYLGEGFNREVKSGDMTLWIGHHDGPMVEDVFASLSSSSGVLPLPDAMFRNVDAPSYPMYVVAERGVVKRGTGENEGTVVLALKEAQAFLDADMMRDDSAGGEGTALTTAPVPAALRTARPEKDQPTPSRKNASNFLQRIRFESIELPLRFKKRTPGPKDMGWAELRDYTEECRRLVSKANVEGDKASLAWMQRDYDGAVTELHRRLALSFASLTFPLTALLIGLRVTSQNRLFGFFVSSAVVPAVYFSLELTGNYLARGGIAPAFTEQLGNIGLLLVGLLIFGDLHRGAWR